MDTSEIDIMIIDAVNNKKFSITIPQSNVKRHYESRGFRVFILDSGHIKISWLNPNITYADVNNYNGKIYKLFTASHIYLKMFNGNDLTQSTPRIVKNRLKNGESINECYGVNNTVIINLYETIIREMIVEHDHVYIHSGVLSLRLLYNNSLEVTLVNGNLNVDVADYEIDDTITQESTIYDTVEW